MVPVKGLVKYPLKNPQNTKDNLLLLLSSCLHLLRLSYMLLSVSKYGVADVGASSPIVYEY